MADPYMGEIKMFGFDFPPMYWAACNGQRIPIQQLPALYVLLGVTYGGDGVTNFQLPNLSARGFCGAGQGPGMTELYPVGEVFGAAAVTLTVPEIAAHNHTINAWEGGSGTKDPAPKPTSALSSSDVNVVYGPTPVNQVMAPQAVTPAGGGLPHENRQPGLPLMLCISLSGEYPTFP